MSNANDPTPPDEARDPSLEALLEAYRDVILDGVYTMLPGTIVAYDDAKQMATVQTSVRRRYIAEDGVTYVSEDLPPIHNCPVEFCGPARGRITWPVATGDTCEVRFSASSLARWVAKGGTSVDPGDDRRHDLADAIAFVGLHTPASPPTDAPTNAVVIHASGGTTIKLGSSLAAEAAVLGSTYRSAEDTMLSLLSVAWATLTTTPGAIATAIAAMTAPQQAAIAAFSTAISNFQTPASTYLSSKTKLE